MGVKEVGEILSHLGLRMEPEGSGIVITQEPSAGTRLPKNSVVKVQFSSPLH
jgi:hypothetical protein